MSLVKVAMMSGRLLQKCVTSVPKRMLSATDVVTVRDNKCNNITGTAASIHTSVMVRSSKWEIPQRLMDIPTAKDPNFFNMVEYFFHRACVLGEESLMTEVSSLRDLSEKTKRKKVHET